MATLGLLSGVRHAQSLRTECRVKHAFESTPYTLISTVPFSRISRPSCRRGRARGPVEVSNFKFLKDLGFKKPSFLPDFGREKRKAILDRFFDKIDRPTYEELLAQNFRMQEEGGKKVYTRDDWIKLMCDTVAPAIPDWNWTHATDGYVDKDGFAIVIVQATGHHTGAPFVIPGSALPPLPADGKRFLLNQEVIRAKVEEGKITEFIVIPSEGAGPRALYVALGGKIPVPIPSDLSPP
eukprot:jgi/Botrbrau1/10818/Bobra.0064s0022.1